MGDIPAGTLRAGEEAEAGMIAGTAATVEVEEAGEETATVEATVEGRVVARAKARERAKDTPVGESTSPKKTEMAQRDIFNGAPKVRVSSMQPLIVHIEYRH